MATEFIKAKNEMKDDKNEFKLKRFQNVEARTTTNRANAKTKSDEPT